MDQKMIEAKKRVNEIMDNMKPFEKIEIEADNQGRLGYFVVKRSLKIIIRGDEKNTQ